MEKKYSKAVLHFILHAWSGYQVNIFIAVNHIKYVLVQPHKEGTWAEEQWVIETITINIKTGLFAIFGNVFIR